jgi:hypothetical protein
MTDPARPAPGPAVTDPGVIAWSDLQDWLGAEPALLPDGAPAVPVLFVDLDAPGPAHQVTSLLQAIAPTFTTTTTPIATPTSTITGPRPAGIDHRVLVGLARHTVRPELVPLTEVLTCTLVAGNGESVPAAQVAVPGLGRASRAIAATAVAAPKAAATLAALLRLTSAVPAEQGLVAESLEAASMPVPVSPAEVIATGPGTWAVRTASGLVPVSPPRARQPRSVAAFLGRDTREVLAHL